jgi:hypothetical protein
MRFCFIFVVTFLSVFYVHAQQKTNGFWGVPFSLTQEAVKSLIATTKNAEPVVQSETQLVYPDVDYEGTKVKAIIYEFRKGKMYSGGYITTYPTAAQALTAYQKLKKECNTKFGEPQKDVTIPPENPGSPSQNICLWLTTDALSEKPSAVSVAHDSENSVMYTVVDRQ